MRLAPLALCCAVLTPAAAQEFQPPDPGGAERGTHIGLYGFGVRGGFDLSADEQFVAGAALDFGQLIVPRLRFRPSVELSVFNGPNRYVGSLDLVYRFTGEATTLIPYAGAGLAVAGRDDCGTDPDCPDLWLNFAAGVELRFRPAFNWLLEYRALDLFGRHRLYAGLTTRRGE